MRDSKRREEKENREGRICIGKVPKAQLCCVCSLHTFSALVSSMAASHREVNLLGAFNKRGIE
jgi:hypothetical protein